MKTVPHSPLTPREVYQILRDLALGTRCMQRLGGLSDTTITLETDGWVLTLHTDQNTLGLCHSCHAPDGRTYFLDTDQRYGTNPVELLSTWEHQQLESMLKAI